MPYKENPSLKGISMFSFNTKVEPTNLDEAIDAVLSRMKDFTAETEEYKSMVERLDTLYKCKALIGPQRLSPDAILGAAASIAGIVAILNFEKVGVITTKALGFVLKAKL